MYATCFINLDLDGSELPDLEVEEEDEDDVLELEVVEDSEGERALCLASFFPFLAFLSSALGRLALPATLAFGPEVLCSHQSAKY